MLATGLEQEVLSKDLLYPEDFKGIYDNSSHVAQQLKGSWMDVHGIEDQTTFIFNKFL